MNISCSIFVDLVCHLRKKEAQIVYLHGNKCFCKDFQNLNL